MRIALSLAALLFLVPTHAAAARVELGYLNSDLTFGFINPNHAGYDLYFVCVFPATPGPDFCLDSDASSTFEALGGTFAEQALLKDGSGTVIGSEYLYEGGTFQIDLTLRNDDGELSTGSFVAPIITLEMSANEGPEANVLAQYLLGPGLFDASIANALGIRRRTVGGSVIGDLLLTDDGNRPGIGGNYASPERQAWDGATHVEIVVPEPPMPILSVLGLTAAWFWRRRSTGKLEIH